MATAQNLSKESDPLLNNTTPNNNNDIEKGVNGTSTQISPASPLFSEDKKECIVSNAESFATSDSACSCISFSTQVTGRLTLVFVAFLYGTLNVSLRMLYALPNPPSASVLSSVRGWLASLAYIPLIPRVRKEVSAGYGRKSSTVTASPDDNESSNSRVSIRKLYLAAFELAVWNFGAQGLLNVGLLFTDAARAAFFTQTSVVMTPLLSFFTGKSVKKSVWMGCIVALTGLVLLSSSSHDDADESSSKKTSVSSSWLYLSPGDIIVLAGAASWSMYIFRVSSLSQHHPEVSLQAYKSIFLASLYTCWYLCSAAMRYNSQQDDDILVDDSIEGSGGWSAVLDLWRGFNDWKAWLILLYSAVGPGTIADILQQGGQKHVSASEANVILCGEPVFTALLSRFILREVTTMMEYFGGTLIILAAILASR